MKVSKMVLIMSWVSKFALLWLMTLRIIPRNDLFTWAVLLIFFIISFLTSASVIADNKKTSESNEH